MKKLFAHLFLTLALAASANAASTRTIEATTTEGFVSHQNLVKQAGFEDGRAQWTASGGTFATTGTNPYRGSYMATWDSNSASQTLMSQSVAIPEGLRGKNAVVSCPIKCATGTCTHVLSAYDGTNEYGATTINSSTATFLPTTINFGAFPSSGNIRLRLRSVASDEPSISFDDCVLMQAEGLNVSSTSIVTRPVSYTPTIGGMGTPTGVDFKWRRVGAYMEVQGAATADASPSGGVSISLPTGFKIDTSLPKFAGGDAYVGHLFTAVASGTPQNYYSAGYTAIAYYNGSDVDNVYFGIQTASGRYLNQTWVTFGSASTGGSFKFSVPIQGWSEQTPAVFPPQLNYDWTAYTPVFTALGTVTSPECLHRREGPDLLLSCKFTKGTGAASEARVSLPNSLVSAGTDKIPSVQSCGSHFNGTASTGTKGGAVLCAPSVSYVNFARSGTFGGTNSVNALLPADGNTIEADGGPIHFTARVPIAGWGPVNAPIVIGAVGTGSTVNERVERARISHSADSTCAITNQSGSWLSSVSCNSAGYVTININAGVFTSAPTCTCSSDNDIANNPTCSFASTPDSATQIRSWQHNGTAAVNDDFRLICMGPRGYL